MQGGAVFDCDCDVWCGGLGWVGLGWIALAWIGLR